MNQFYVSNKNNLPFYTDGENSFPCAISAGETVVDFEAKSPLNKEDVKSYLTESEIKSYYDVRFVDSWDKRKQAIVKVSNKVVSSIQEKKK